MATYDQVSMVMEQMAAVFPGGQLSGTKIKIYSTRLQDIPFQALQEAANDLIDTEEFFPSIAKLRAASMHHKSQVVGQEGCPACRGIGLVSRDLPVGHPHFGRAYPCPRCFPAEWQAEVQK